jgi:predicted nucleic acid-binding protein
MRDVLTRPNVIAKLRLRPDRIQTFIEAVVGAATVLNRVPETFAYERDPDDAHYVNLALAAGARLIVSRDHDLLDLMDPASAEGAKFRSDFPSLRIVDPVAFLQEVAQTFP